MKLLLKISLLLLVATIFASYRHQMEVAREGNHNDTVPQNSIYHWKTVFDVDSAENSFLKKHGIDRIYLRMFDVATEQNLISGDKEVVPIATTRFDSPVPSGIEIVPVTYITLDALKGMSGRESEFAALIVERLLVMASYNKCGEIKEVQFDCDWTRNTKESYSKLCRAAKDSLHSKGIELSITVRLHQLDETPPPADRGVLMIYNTGALKDPCTNNSILHIDDVEPYMKPRKYAIPLDYAYPNFSWGVKFNRGKFSSIVSYDDHNISGNEYIRYERASTYMILLTKKLIEENFGKPERGNILYHLDYSQLKNYTDDEISEIFSF